MQYPERIGKRSDAYTLLPDMDSMAEENVSLLAPGQTHSINTGDAIAPNLRPLRKQISMDGAGTGEPPEDSALRSAVNAVRLWKSNTKRAAVTRHLRDVIEQVLERHKPGTAPGIDPRRSKYQHLASKWCLPAKITIVDFDSKEMSIQSGLDSSEQLSAFLSRPRERPRSRARHMNFECNAVYQVLALKFNLHPLALEDTVHVPQRIKADFYDSCLYVSLIYLYLARGEGSDDADNGTPVTAAPVTAATQGLRHRTAAPPPLPSAANSSSPSSSSQARPRTVEKAEVAAAAARPHSRLHSAAAAAAVAAAAAPPRDVEGHGGFYPLPGVEQRQLVGSPGPTHYPLPLRRGCMSLPASAAATGGGGGGGDSSTGCSSVHVSAQQVSLFLLRGDHPNTLITIFQSDGSQVTEPILAQLREQRTLVREAEDASFLANLVIDTIVDHIFPVVGAYREQLQQYEGTVMASSGSSSSASAASTRELHAMQRDLRRIDRTIAPLQVVGWGLRKKKGDVKAVRREYEGDMGMKGMTEVKETTPGRLRGMGPGPNAVVANMVSRDSTPLTAAAAATTSAPIAAANATTTTTTTTTNNNNNNNNNNAATAVPFSTASLVVSAATCPGPSPGPGPFLSPLTSTYLNDVRDHVSTICEDLLSLSSECGDLIGLIFNLTTLQQSQSTQALAVVSTIFLPITFLAGVYGMNFDIVPELHWSYGYLYFWLTSMAIVVVFMVVMQRAGLWSWAGSVVNPRYPP
ncbi:hypothetical protein VOLCADRAFT_93751 [Volvox carteri f. nagariensis]|uniref:Uncharacterized protein n=1 Tax=Volvox carteri f. nagariensis TaxID=3068 RepID=D8U2Z0_VOLCA|nr:uncharacterized protein VOLCADRAFT_93751 [Volvox carteri f. nagariensis]EFJ45984.1 hypothetical protein VOLCADRAFT_93751 [Volvox carteri f. nagariensis]|eukprot:XP_002953062.1 hypothetical protein VOLCADRAFT_93751 [Volvox carteri f. nagariensis]